MTKKIGFACKYSYVGAKGEIESIPDLNTKVTTVAWLNRQHRDIAAQRLWDLMKHNIESARLLVKRVGELEEHLRMVRLSSDILPVYTEQNWSWFWRQPEVRAYCEREFAKVGELARQRGVRLSFHPGQFTVLASENPDIVERSIEEFEYHVDMVRWMGFGKSFQDFKVNVHISGRRGPQGIIDILPRLSTEARNTITIENDEMSWGLDASLELADHVALVLDIHHHWVNTGDYIQPTDPRLQRVIDSWRGVRPVIHYSVSREDVLTDHCVNTLPDYRLLLESGHKKQKLRAHSDYYWNRAVNDWAISFLDRFDIMSESKAKNLASFELAKRARELGVIV